ncbi:MAG: hypothetical protein B7Z22_09165 [Hyphomonas sp. 32-62-5]|nr:MAG: hypothetical protein B7Z22_09165 [Hyphomonas sp. 32-62-5]
MLATLWRVFITNGTRIFWPSLENTPLLVELAITCRGGSKSKTTKQVASKDFDIQGTQLVTETAESAVVIEGMVPGAENTAPDTRKEGKGNRSRMRSDVALGRAPTGQCAISNVSFSAQN